MITIFSVIMNAVSRFFAGEKPSSIKSLYYVEHGNSKLDKGRVDDSIELFKKAIELDTKNFYAYVSMAAAYMEKGMFEQVIHYCNRAIEIKQDVFCHISLSIAYALTGNDKMSIEAFNMALPYYKGNRAALYNELAYRYANLEKYEEAERCCDEAIRLFPDEYGLYMNLGKIFLRQNKLGDAKIVFEKAMGLTDDRRSKKYLRDEIEKINITTGQIHHAL